MHDVNGRFPASGCILQYFRGFAKESISFGDQRKDFFAGGKSDGACDFDPRCIYGDGSGKLGVRDRILCMGRIRRSIRTGYASGAVLETFQSKWGDREHDLRKYLVRPMGGAWDIYELLPAFLVAIVLNVVVSLLTAPPQQEILDEFEKAARG